MVRNQTNGITDQMDLNGSSDTTVIRESTLNDDYWVVNAESDLNIHGQSTTSLPACDVFVSGFWW